MNIREAWKTVAAGALACAVLTGNAQNQSADALINKLLEKGILTQKEADELRGEAVQTNVPSASKWRIDKAIKEIGLFGDLRFRYEHRSAENVPGSGATGDNYVRDRFRYAARIGLRGDLFDNFFYGLRVDTSSNPRSPWVTFGDDTSTTPSAKNSDGINIGQVYLGWRATDWFEMTVGKMPMPLYVTPMIWDTDINPEGSAEKFKASVGNNLDLFASFGQFMYQDTNPDSGLFTSDTFLLAWQLGAQWKFTDDVSLKIAPVLYNYAGSGAPGSSVSGTFTGEGYNGLNTNTAAAYNQGGINNLLVLEIPAEFNFKAGPYDARVFADFAYNLQGADRARAAFQANQASITPLPHAFTGAAKAYQLGFAIGNLGLVYSQTSKKRTWEGRVYWQHVEQYAADVNLLDSDFFEGRGNLQGVYTALAYSITDNIIGTFRYGYAQRINDYLGTGGDNPDLPVLNPIRNYHLLQVDLGWRF
jgi:hypothetical protein